MLADAEVRATVESARGALKPDNGISNLELRAGVLALLASLPAEQQVQAVQQLVDQGQATRAQVRSLARALQSALSQPPPAPRAGSMTIQPWQCVADSRYQLHVADARHLPLGDGSAHLIVTSPPYNARNAWFIPATLATDANGNPAAFPAELPRRLIKLYSYVGDLIVDPFVGGGSTVVAAVAIGRHASGSDLGPSEIERSRHRVARCYGREHQRRVCCELPVGSAHELHVGRRLLDGREWNEFPLPIAVAPVPGSGSC